MTKFQKQVWVRWMDKDSGRAGLQSPAPLGICSVALKEANQTVRSTRATMGRKEDGWEQVHECADRKNEPDANTYQTRIGLGRLAEVGRAGSGKLNWGREGLARALVLESLRLRR